MKRTTTALITIAAATLALAACSTDSSSASEETEPLSITSVTDLDSHIADTYNGTAELNDRDLTVTLESRGTELQDQDATLRALQDVGSSDLDYDSVTVTSSTDDGTWGYRYSADTVHQLADTSVSDGSIVVTEIWDHADEGTNFAY